MRTKAGLYAHLVLAGIGVCQIILGVYILSTTGILVALLLLPLGLFLIIYGLRQFLGLRAVSKARQIASKNGTLVPRTVVGKKISSLGRVSYWSLSATVQLSGKELKLTDKFLYKDIVDQYEIGSVVNVKVVLENPDNFEFQFEET